MNHKRWVVLSIALLALAPGLRAAVGFDKYHTPAELASALQEIAQANTAAAKVHKLAVSPGGREVLITKDSHLKAALLNRSGTRIVAGA